MNGLLRKIHGLIVDITKVSNFNKMEAAKKKKSKKKKNVRSKEGRIKIINIDWRIKR